MKYLLTLCCLYITTNAFSQVTRLDSLLTNKQYNHVERELSELLTFNKDSNAYWYYAGKLQTYQRNLQQAFSSLKKVDTTEFEQKYKAWYYYVLGDAYRYSNQEEKAYELKLKAQKLFHATGNEKMVNEVNYDLYYTLSSQKDLQYNGTYYAKEYFKKASTLQDTLQLSIAHLVFSRLEDTVLTKDEIQFHLNKAKLYVDALGTIPAKYRFHNYKTAYYQGKGYDLKKAELYVDSMLYYAKRMNSPDRLQSSLRTKAYGYQLQGNYEKAIEVLKEAEKLPIKENVFNRKKGLYYYLSLNYEYLGNTDSAFFYYRKMVAYRDSVNISTQNTMLTLLETVELSQKNLLLDAERIKQREHFLITLIILIAIVIISIILILYYRSKKLLAEKEKQIAEKEKEIVEQEKEIAEKEKEIKAIDARNEEKDKQRQRMAGELHDNLGSLFVAIQHCFDNLKASKNHFQQEEDKLIARTRELINQAYKKVRNMAHLEDSASQNSGYWVDVIKNFAAIMNESKKLTVEVHSHGTTQIVNMTTENDLRRMTTELITNAVKHSKASEVSVDITAGDKSLTIIVEDDGIGLDKIKLGNQKGYGLYSIQRKVEELKGIFTIDSTENNGTTFIIEIPL